MDQPESMEVDSTKDSTLEPEEKQDSAVEKETTEEEHSPAVESDEQCDMSSSDIGLVVMDEDLPQSEIIDIDKTGSDQQCDEANAIQDQEGEDEQANPLCTSDEQENTDKQELEADLSQMSDTEESNNEGSCSVSKATENNTSLDKQSVISSSGERSEEVTETQEDGICSEDADAGANADAAHNTSVECIAASKEDDNEDIVEVPVHRKPTVLVDLSDDDENVDKNQRKNLNKESIDDLSIMEDKAASNESKKIKLRSLASLVDDAGGDDMPTNSHPDIPGIGEIVEHGVIIGSDEMDGLQLRISNVVGGEDCITGLTVDEDRDAFSSIQISSVTTLIDPISPEDPNQIDNSSENPTVDEENEKGTEENRPCLSSTLDSTTEPENSSAGAAASDIVNLAKGDAKKSVENNDDSSEMEKSSNRRDLTGSGSASPKLHLSTAVTVSVIKELLFCVFSYIV